MALFIAFLSLLITTVIAQSTFSPARPPAIPLAVRSPYLSTWQAAGSDGGNGGYLAGQWPSFWNGAITGWTGMIKVDNETYTWMGAPASMPTVVSQTSFSYTSTRSIFTLDVGGNVTMNVTFMSPVTPNDMLRQSFPVSYMNVEVISTDGGQHDVQLYTDISAEWTSGDRSQVAQWSYGTTNSASKRSISTSANSANGTSGGVAYHQVWRQLQEEFTEDDEQAAWGYWYYATETVQGLTYQSGADTDVRGAFMNSGKLANTQDTNYRAIDDDYPVFGYALDLGSVGSSPVNSLFTINLAQDAAILFNSGSGNAPVASYWTSQYSDDLSAVSFFYGDYSNVAGLATTLDNQVSSDSTAAGGDDYLTLTSLAVRQAWGAIQFCGNESTQYIFLKEISSDGDIQTVDVIFPFWSIISYMNPSWGKLLLDPLYINQEAGLWPNTYSIHDLGSYPNATGHEDGQDEMQPLEECGDMLIMTLDYAQKTGDTDYLSTHYNLLNQWTQYLINDSLIPMNQISTDDFAGSLANQTNLALKGMIGIEAMAVIANLTGNSADGANYTNIAHSYITQWQTLGIAQDESPPHTTLAYGMNDTHGLLYNLYADQLLGTHLVPTSVYTMQSDFYPTVENTYGVPLDTRHDYTKNDWQMLCAAIAASNTSSMFIGDIAKWINETPTNSPVTDLYDTETGDFAVGVSHFMARPVVGGWFSLLALNQTGIPSDNPS